MDNNQAERRKRLMTFINSLETKHKTFALRVGTKPAVVSQILNGHSNLTTGMVYRIGQAYPKLNRDWLLTGEGEMLMDDKKMPGMEEPGAAYGQTEGEPTMQMVEALHQQVLASYRPDPPLTVRQEITLRQACYKTLHENPGQPWSALVLGAGVYLRFIQAFPNLILPEWPGQAPVGGIEDHP